MSTTCWLALGSHSARAEGRKLAVVVGVDAYRANSGLGRLSHATADAQRIGRALRGAGFSVTEMTHAAARVEGQEHLAPNLADIRDQIEAILDTPNLGPDDAVLVTLHGHGVFLPHEGSSDEAGLFYFCPTDARIQNARTADQVKDRNRLLPIEELYDSLGRCGAATKLLVVDACRNDPNQPQALRSGLASATMPKLPPPPRGMAAFFSCKQFQRAVEDKELGQGVFSHFFARGLEGAADQATEDGAADGVVTLAELTSYVANNTYAYVRKKYAGMKQSPDMKGEFDTNLPLAQAAPKPVKPTRPGLLKVPFTAQQAGKKQAEWARYLGQQVQFTNSIGGKMRLIPPGRYQMGSSETSPAPNQRPHDVAITRPFYAGVYEVTLGEFKTFIRETGYKTNAEKYDDGTSRGWDPASRRFVNGRGFTWRAPGWSQEDSHPVVNVTWNDADRFVEWLSKKERRRYRLLTEAEWEYCCRSGASTLYSFGNDHNQLTRHGNVLDTAGWRRFAGDPNFRQQSVNELIANDDGAAFTTSVGSYRPNNLGLFDFHGNVCEWCLDWYQERYYQLSEKDPSGPANGAERCARGGRFDTGGILAKSFTRNRGVPGMSDMILGFRVAMEIEP